MKKNFLVQERKVKVNDMTKTVRRMMMAVIAMVILCAGLAYGLYWNSYWNEVRDFGQTIVWQEGRYEVTSFMDNQRRVREHRGIDDPIMTATDVAGYRYIVYDDGSCERLSF